MGSNDIDVIHTTLTEIEDISDVLNKVIANQVTNDTYILTRVEDISNDVVCETSVSENAQGDVCEGR